MKKESDVRVVFQEFENITLCVGIELREFFSKCITNDSVELNEIREQLFSSDAKLFVGISLKKSTFGRDKWKACTVIVKNKSEHGEKNFRVCASSHDVTHDHLKSAFDDIREIFVDFHQNCDDDGSYSIIDALKFLDVFSQKTLEGMATTLIENSLNQKFITKSPASRFIDLFHEFLTEGNEIHVNDEQLNNIVHIIKSKNFEKGGNYEKDIPLETLKILKLLKIQNLAKFDEGVLLKIREFLMNHRNSYRSIIQSTLKIIKEKPSDKTAIYTLQDALKGRIDFLTCMAIFGSTDLNISDFLEVLECKSSPSQSLNKQIQDLKSIRQDIDDIKSDPSHKAPKSAIMILSNKFMDLKKIINFNITVERIKNKLEIDEFIVEYEKKFDQSHIDKLQNLKKTLKPDENKSKTALSKPEIKTFKLLLEYIEKFKLKKTEAWATLSILSKSNKKHFIDIPGNIIEALNENDQEEDQTEDFLDRDSILLFGINKELNKPINYIEYVTKTLTEHGSSTYTALKKYMKHLDDKGKLAVDLFDAIKEIEQIRQLTSYFGIFLFLSNFDNISKAYLLDPKKLLVQVIFSNLFKMKKIIEAYKKIKQMLLQGQIIPNEVYKLFTYAANCSATYLLISDILHHDNQEMPKDVALKVVEFVEKSTTKTSTEQLNVINLFLLRGLVNIGDIEQLLISAMSDTHKIEANKEEEIKVQEGATVVPKETFTSSSLKMIYNAKQLGQSISSKTMNFISNLSITKENMKIKKFITEEETDLDKLTKGSTKIDEKLKILDRIEEGFDNYRDEGSIRIFIDVVLYDEEITKRAFEVLLKIIPEKFPLKNHEICILLIQLLKNDVDFNDVEKFLAKLETNIDEILGACEDDILVEKLNDSLKFVHFTVMTEEKIEEVLTNDKELSESNISMVIGALEMDQYSSFHKNISSLLKKANEEKTLSGENLQKIKSILVANFDHPQFHELLELLPDDLKTFVESIKYDPNPIINENIKKLELNHTDQEVLKILSKELLNELTNEHVQKLQNLCAKICQAIKDCDEESSKLEENDTCDEKLNELSHKYDQLFLSLRGVIKILSHHVSGLLSAERFLGDILKFIITNLNFNDDAEKLIIEAFLCNSTEGENEPKVQFNEVATINFIIALLYVKINQTELHLDIFKEFSPNQWNVELLIATLLSMCDETNEFYLDELLQTFKRDLQVKLSDLLKRIIDINEGFSIDIKEIIDLITIVSSDEEIFERFLNNDEPLRLYEMWLKNKFMFKNNDFEVRDLKTLMSYQPKIIEMMLDSDNKNQLNSKEFVRIFKALQHCSTITHAEKCFKLLILISNESITWLSTIELFLIDDLMMTKLKKFNGKKMKNLRRGLQRIYHTGWSIDSIGAIINKIKTDLDVDKVINALRLLHQYKIDELFSNVKGETALEVSNFSFFLN